MDQPSYAERALYMWHSFPELSRRLSASIIIWWFACTYFPSLITLFSLAPGAVLRVHLWCLLSFAWVETSLISSLLNALCLIAIGRTIEPIWGPKELLKFLGVVIVGSGICTFFTSILMAIILPDTWMSDYYCGFYGVLAGLTVALKQLTPDFEVQFWFVPIRLKYLPSVLVVLSFTLDLFLGSSTRPVGVMLDETGKENIALMPRRNGSALLVIWSVYVSWIYLRFFQYYLTTDPGSDNIFEARPDRGDPSESFAFHTFFPDVVQPYARRLGNITNRYFLQLRSRAHLSTNGGSSHGRWSPNPNPSAPQAPVGRTLGGGSPVSEEEVRRKAASAAIQRFESNTRSRSDDNV